MRKSITRILAVTALLLGAPLVSAGVIDPYLNVNGDNVLEDDSGELVFRPIYEDGVIVDYTVATGNIQVGDILLGILDYGTVNGTNVDSEGVELTSIFIVEVGAVGPTGSTCTSSLAYGNCSILDPTAGLTYDSVELAFQSVDAQVWDDLLGIDLTVLGGSLGADLTGTTQMFWDDAANNLQIINPGDVTAAAIAHATDGDLRFILGDTGTGDGMSAQDAPLQINTFVDPNLDAGVSLLGTFSYINTFLWDDLSGTQERYSATGNNYADNTTCCAVQDDTQGTYASVPTPGTLFLLGAGALGLGFGSRRRKIG